MQNDFSLDLNSALGQNLDFDPGLDPQLLSGAAPSASTGSDDFLSLGNLGKLGQLGVGLAGMFNSYQQNQLRKKAFKFQKGVTNRNIANQAVTVNNQLSNQAKMQAQLFGNKVGTQDYNNYIAANQKSVNGSAI